MDRDRGSIWSSGFRGAHGRAPGTAGLVLIADAGVSEYTGTLIVEAQFVSAQAGARKFRDLLRREKLRPFYAYAPASFGVVNPDDVDPPAAADDS